MRLDMMGTQHLMLLLAAASVCWQAMAANEITDCEDKSIYIMDLGMFSAEHGIPQCSYTVRSPLMPCYGILQPAFSQTSRTAVDAVTYLTALDPWSVYTASSAACMTATPRLGKCTQ